MNERTFYCFLYTWSHRVNYEMLKKNLRDIILINASSTLLVLLTLPYTDPPPPPPTPRVSRPPHVLPSKFRAIPIHTVTISFNHSVPVGS